jgi:hypothetical protein
MCVDIVTQVYVTDGGWWGAMDWLSGCLQMKECTPCSLCE